MNILFDIYQHFNIKSAQSAAETAQLTAERLSKEVEDLRARCDTLALACQALWEIVRSTTGLNDEAILSKMQEIDLRDGVLDGKITPRMTMCSSCGRANNTRRNACVYCGTQLPSGQVFDKA